MNAFHFDNGPRRFRRISARIFAACAMASLAATGAGGARNIALHCMSTMQPRPNYRLCTDPGDRTQLTNGIFSKER